MPDLRLLCFETIFFHLTLIAPECPITTAGFHEEDGELKEMKTETFRIPLWFVAFAVLSITCVSSFHTYRGLNFFDDAFMFYRYALNFRHGLGWSWNLDGVHTFGMSSLTWQWIVLLASLVPVHANIALICASTLTYVVAFIFLTWFFSRHALSTQLRSPVNALLFLALPLESQYVFRQHVSNGMDTMLAFLFSGMLACLSVVLLRRATRNLALLSGALAYLSIATRPESAICALLVPALMLLIERRRWLALLHVGVTVVLTAVQMLFALRYFGTAVPLAFYLKARHAYVAYIGYKGASEQFEAFAFMAAAYVVLLILFTRRNTLSPVLCLLVPVALTAAYLMTVTQIMGAAGRYYVPYLPYIIVAAWLSMDVALAYGRPLVLNWTRAVVAFALLLFFSPPNVQLWVLNAQYKFKAQRVGVALPQLLPARTPPLPEVRYLDALRYISDEIVAIMPAGSWFAATEVGYPAVVAPQVNILDLAGLNSRDVVQSAFSPDVVFQHRPDVLWLPHNDYTGMRANLLRDPRLLQQYDLIVGAYCFGIAVRKDSRQHDTVLREVANHWAAHYPGTAMQDYLVHMP